jgi:predicted ATPase
VAKLLDEKMRTRVDEHFSAAKAAVERISRYLDKKEGIDVNDVLVIPLIERTKSMVDLSRKLEEDRKTLFTPLQRYESIANSFLNGESGKTVRVEDDGRICIKASIPQTDLSPYLLSSGEKQLLILLTQALLWEDRPVVYVVDEPELSLHVKWQERLLKSLVELGGQIQIIVATHSPDIIGPFTDRVIDLGVKR